MTFIITKTELEKLLDPWQPFPDHPTPIQRAAMILYVSDRDPEAALDTAARHLLDIDHLDPRRKHWRDTFIILLGVVEEPTLLREKTA